MIRVYHGDDDFSKDEAVARVRMSLGIPEIRDANTTELEGKFKLAEVMAVAMAMPFLADKRAVIVRDLLTRVEANNKSVGDEWDGLASHLKGVPSSTELIFVESKVERDDERDKKRADLRKGGRGLRVVGQGTEVREFRELKGEDLNRWVRDRVANYGGDIQPDAVARLVLLVGGNLRLLDQEIRKLTVHSFGREVRRADVDLLVSAASEESIFDAVDEVLERRPGAAMKRMYALLDEGRSSSEILTMLARQVRVVLLARELRGSGVSQDEIGKRIGITHPYALEKTLRQAQRFDFDYLASVHRRLLNADIAIKVGESSERLAVEMLVADLTR